MSPKFLRPRSFLMALIGICALVCVYLFGRMQGPTHIHPMPSVVMASSAGDHDDAGPPSTSPQRSPSSAALPGRDVPLKKTLPGLRERASAGDLAAATRLYRDLRFCGTLDGMEWFFSGVADELLDQKIDGSAAQDLENYRVQLDAIEGRKQAMRKFHAFCEGVDRNALDGQLPSLQRAALLGDEQARACYLLRGPNYDPAGLVRHPEWLQGYRANVKSLIDAGVAAGDWRVVDIVRSAYQPGSEGVLAGALGSDPALYYRYLKLYGLGSAPDRNHEIDQQLASAAARIAPGQRADADRWAQAKFSQAFGQSSAAETTPRGWDACSFSTVPYDGE